MWSKIVLLGVCGGGYASRLEKGASWLKRGSSRRGATWHLGELTWIHSPFARIYIVLYISLPFVRCRKKIQSN